MKPWEGEPDRLEWRHEGVVCLIIRNQLGVLCGYAACPPGHPWHGKDKNDIRVTVHGGPTFSGLCQEPICHLPAPGEPEHVWWVGFDCGRGGDYVPSFAGFHSPSFPEVYRDIAYVKAECEALADQILKAAFILPG